MELKEFTIGILTKALGLKAEEAEELLGKPEGLKQALKIHADQVQELKTEAKENFDDGYKKAEGEIRRKLERELKSEFNIDSSAKGLDLVKEIVEANSKQEGQAKEFTDEEVKKHPLFLKLEKDTKKAVEEAKTEAENKIKAFESEIQEKETFKTVEAKVASEITNLKVALHSDATKAEKQKATIIKELKSAGYKFEVKGESVLVLKPDGSRLEDEHGHAIPLSNLVKQTAEDLGFDFQASDKRDSADAGGNGDSGQGNERKYKGDLPKTEEEYVSKIMDQNLSVEERLEIQTAWNENQGK